MGAVGADAGTEHRPPRGAIYYNIRSRGKKKRYETKPTQYFVTDFVDEYDELKPQVKAELPNKIRYYEPENPDYPKTLALRLSLVHAG